MLRMAKDDSYGVNSLRVLSDFGLRVKAVDTLQSFFMLIMRSVQRPLRLIGMISDRDLRRLFERNGPRVHDRIADKVMNLRLRAIAGAAFAASALVLTEERKITSLIVAGVDGLTLGVAHLHDLWILEPI
jgi:CBS domain-containing protein